MSLSWRDRLLVWLAPSELSWVRLGGIFQPALRAKRTVPVEAGHGARAWDGAIAALRAETAQWMGHNLDVRIVLSTHFVRYALVPHSDSVSGQDEELALARFHFSKIHGEASRSWDIRLSPAPSGGSRLACATDTALKDALRQSFANGTGPRLASVQPLLMSVFNSSRSSIPDAGAWLVMAEADRTCVALIQGKIWHAVQNTKGRFADAAAWVDLVQRERWRISLDKVPEAILVHSTLPYTSPGARFGEWTVGALQSRWPIGLLPARDSAYISALGAA